MFQTIIIAGNLGKEPEMRYTPNGDAVTAFSVAVNRNHKDANGESIKDTTWFRVTTWRKQAETCNQYLHKGSKVLVEGYLQSDPATGGPRLWTGQDGAYRASFEITAQTVRFLSSKSENESNAPVGAAGTEDNQSTDPVYVADEATAVSTTEAPAVQAPVEDPNDNVF